MNVKEKIKIFWKNFTENWLWVTIGVYTGTILMGWIEYFRGFLPLIGVLLPTFVFPLFLFGIYYIRKLNSSSFEEIFPKLGDFIESLDYNADENFAPILDYAHDFSKDLLVFLGENNLK